MYGRWTATDAALPRSYRLCQIARCRGATTPVAGLPPDQLARATGGLLWRVPGDYVAGHALGIGYGPDAIPDEATLRRDLRNVVRAFRALTFRGGIEGDVEPQSDLSDEFNIPSQDSVIETRKYVYHRKIERNRTAAKNAKKFHGTSCQACNLTFSEQYGPIGEGFIEAHHLKPIGTLEEGVPVKYDVASDFAVLCSNCHRMIHRTADPSDLDGFRKLIMPPIV